MDLEQCYKELEGDYAEVMRRLRKEELVHRFLIKFLESDEVQRIDEALQERDYEKAFDLVHTLKRDHDARVGTAEQIKHNSVRTAPL